MSKRSVGRPRKPRNPGFERAIAACGGKLQNLADRLGLSLQGVHKWGRDIPIDRIEDVERVTGVPRQELRPDFFAPRPWVGNGPMTGEIRAA